MSTPWGYRAYMALKWGAHTRDLPRIKPVNTVLKTHAEVQQSVAEAERLKLPAFSDPPKTWDTLGALHEVVTRTSKDARVLDAGAEMYSRILPWLYLYGYRNLYGNNLVFDKTRTVKHGTISYEYGDITATVVTDRRRRVLDLALGRAVDAGVGRARLPFPQEGILLGQAGERAAFQRVVLHVLHARLDLALVPRHVRACSVSPAYGCSRTAVHVVPHSQQYRVSGDPRLVGTPDGPAALRTAAQRLETGTAFSRFHLADLYHACQWQHRRHARAPSGRAATGGVSKPFR